MSKTFWLKQFPGGVMKEERVYPWDKQNVSKGEKRKVSDEEAERRFKRSKRKELRRMKHAGVLETYVKSLGE